uniref:RNA-dependent RNA polymerase n=1 Tax=Panagrolaimus sp. ES5 TaxID=591445 RepID=A0AC34GHJ2_9BILA
MFKFLKKDISLTALNFDPNDFPDEIPVGNQYVAIKTAIITPTKILYEIEEVTVNNRGFRKCGPEMFLQIKFRDEDMTPFPRDTASISARIGDSLINGISVGEKMYFDFGSSSSLFRQHGTYFLEANNQNVIVDIIDEWAEFKREPAAKLAARFGLFFSSAT